MPPPPDSIDKAYQTLKASYIDTLTNNAADALVDGEVRAMRLMKLPINFRLVNSRAVEATKQYRETLIRFGGSDVTEIGADGFARRVFKPWLKDAIESDKEQVATIIREGIRNGTPLKTVEKSLDDVFAMREHNARLTAYQETKQLFNKGTTERYREEHVQQGRWVHMDPQPDPREDHQDLDGRVFDLDDPVWAELDLPYCRCYMEPVLPGSR